MSSQTPDNPALLFERSKRFTHCLRTRVATYRTDAPGRGRHLRGKTFEPSRALSDDGAGYPNLAVDGSYVVVSWERIAGPHARSRGLALAVSRDGGTRFGEPTLVEHSIDPAGGFNGSHQGRLMEKLAVRNGLIVVANSALAPGRASRAWFVRGQLPHGFRANR